LRIFQSYRLIVKWKLEAKFTILFVSKCRPRAFSRDWKHFVECFFFFFTCQLKWRWHPSLNVLHLGRTFCTNIWWFWAPTKTGQASSFLTLSSLTITFNPHLNIKPQYKHTQKNVECSISSRSVDSWGCYKITDVLITIGK
jgi:hypothetical protein